MRAPCIPGLDSAQCPEPTLSSPWPPMKKARPSARKEPVLGPTLFTTLSPRRRRVLILPRYLAEEAAKLFYQGKEQDKARGIVGNLGHSGVSSHLSLPSRFGMSRFPLSLTTKSPSSAMRLISSSPTGLFVLHPMASFHDGDFRFRVAQPLKEF